MRKKPFCCDGELLEALYYSCASDQIWNGKGAVGEIIGLVGNWGTVPPGLIFTCSLFYVFWYGWGSFSTESTAGKERKSNGGGGEV